MAYYGNYPEPLNDPEFDKNSDDFTGKNVLQLMLIVALAFVITLVACSPVLNFRDTEEEVISYIEQSLKSEYGREFEVLSTERRDWSSGLPRCVWYTTVKDLDKDMEFVVVLEEGNDSYKIYSAEEYLEPIVLEK